MSTTTTKKRTITLTDRAPIRIAEDRWPLIASGTGRSRVNYGAPIPDYETDGYSLRVRQHADGRAIVYGVLDASTAWTGTEDRAGGELLAADDDVPAAIRRVGEYCELPDAIIRECIADLPPLDIA